MCEVLVDVDWMQCFIDYLLLFVCGIWMVYLWFVDFVDFVGEVVDCVCEMVLDVWLDFEIWGDMFIFGDEVLLIWLFENFIGNGRCYGQGVDMMVWVWGEFDCVRLIVQDVGLGVFVEVLFCLIEFFYQVDVVCSGEGNGLGFVIVDWIVQLYGGIVLFEVMWFCGLCVMVDLLCFQFIKNMICVVLCVRELFRI